MRYKIFGWRTRWRVSKLAWAGNVLPRSCPTRLGLGLNRHQKAIMVARSINQ